MKLWSHVTPRLNSASAELWTWACETDSNTLVSAKTMTARFKIHPAYPPSLAERNARATGSRGSRASNAGAGLAYNIKGGP
jgi:hypothetical protein